MRVGREITIGHRPNVVKVVDGNVFVGSFKRPAVSILSAKSGRPRSVSPTVGLGITDAAVGSGSVWFAVSRAKQVVRLSARTGKPQGAPIPLPGGPGSIAVSPDAIWVGLVNAGAPDVLLKIDRRTGETLQSVQYPYGIISIATSPSAVWVVSRRRSRVQRVDPATAQVVRTVQFGRSRGADIEYRDGAVWIPSPADDTVYKVLTRTGDIIPIGVGRQPRQVALGDDGRVYVTNYNSSDLYAIDEKRSRVDGPPVGLAVNPFGLAAANGAVWVASQPDNRLAEVLTGRGG
jgi:streptogramin lyase